MRMILLAVVAAMLITTVVQGQKSLEGPLTFAPLITRDLFRAVHKDSTTFRLSGSAAVDSSGVMHAAATTGLTIKSVGDSVNYTMYFFSGVAKALTSNVAQADTNQYQFAAPFDSLTVTAAGVVNKQISSNMDIAPHWYARFKANAGNGTKTTATAKVHRQQ